MYTGLTCTILVTLSPVPSRLINISLYSWTPVTRPFRSVCGTCQMTTMSESRPPSWWPWPWWVPTCRSRRHHHAQFGPVASGHYGSLGGWLQVSTAHWVGDFRSLQPIAYLASGFTSLEPIGQVASSYYGSLGGWLQVTMTHWVSDFRSLQPIAYLESGFTSLKPKVASNYNDLLGVWLLFTADY